MLRYMKRLITLFCLVIPIVCFAASGMADRREEFVRWLLQAGIYCTVFGSILFVLLDVASVIWKSSSQSLLDKFRCYLLKYSSTIGVLILGLFLSIVFGLSITIFDWLFWILAIIPLMIAVVGLPIILSFKKFRNKWLGDTGFLKWAIIFSLSAVIASLVFIILVECGMIPDLRFYIESLSRQSFRTHPYESLGYIWMYAGIFLIESIVCLPLIWIGIGMHKLYVFFKQKSLTRTRK